MYLITGVAFLFYVTKIPERYFPGESLERSLQADILLLAEVELLRHLTAFGAVSPPRSAELPGRQPPGVAHSGGGDVLLVASDRRLYHALQAQPTVRAAEQQQHQQLKPAHQIQSEST